MFQLCVCVNWGLPSILQLETNYPVRGTNCNRWSVNSWGTPSQPTSPRYKVRGWWRMDGDKQIPVSVVEWSVCAHGDSTRRGVISGRPGWASSSFRSVVPGLANNLERKKEKNKTDGSSENFIIQEILET